ncbi:MULTISPECIES: hypothetical protein [Rhodococcus]|uniref:Phosphate transport system protein PhoU n=1 Tax=Rhodococcus ruber TaxID=1830 RepID=A0A098BR82_9NOCA|nr:MULTISPECIES: hypothetical protein [Rhodococcus]QRI79289.1 hypothetical protein JQ505_28240 [Rhodococcus aetherivorans]QSE62474.1 hypothetical protein JYA75_28035 [Rhodococcus sp. PSBB066]MCF8784301.1 hypothetical protein [Rhodococcus ruber]MDO1481824.1 hypothetical protein [Rhodococcus ruber]MDV6258955.1 hypothetical protein [Rhodococcus ruber]
MAGLSARAVDQVLRTLGEPAAERGRRDDELEDLHRRLLPSIQDPSRRGSLQAAVG